MKLFRTLSIQEKALRILLKIFGNVNPAARSTVVVLLIEAIQTISSLFIFFFYEKISRAQKAIKTLRSLCAQKIAAFVV